MEVPVEDRFKRELFKKYEACKKVYIPKEEYFLISDQQKMISVDTKKKTHHEYYLISKFEILQYGDVEKLTRKRLTEEDTHLYYVSIEDTFDIIKRAHISTSHGERDRMVKELSKQYVNVTREAVELSKSLCVVCQWKRKRPTTKGVVVQPILTKEFSSRNQVDLIDMQSLPSGKFKWIMVYQDHLTKFCILRALSSKRASEVAYQLMDIFLIFGVPHVLQSDNGSEFTDGILDRIGDCARETKTPPKPGLCRAGKRRH